jgi:hypothetical protein
MTTDARQARGATFLFVAILSGCLAVVSLLYLALAVSVGHGYWFIAPFLVATALSTWLAARLSGRQQISERLRFGATVLQFAVLGSYLFSVGYFRGEFEPSGLVWGFLIGPATLICVAFCVIRLLWGNR